MLKSSRRGFLAFLGLGASAVAAKASPVAAEEVPKRLNLNRGKPGSVLASIEDTLKEMINREANLKASGGFEEKKQKIVEVYDIEWPQQTIDEKQREMVKMLVPPFRQH